MNKPDGLLDYNVVGKNNKLPRLLFQQITIYKVTLP